IPARSSMLPLSYRATSSRPAGRIHPPIASAHGIRLGGRNMPLLRVPRSLSLAALVPAALAAVSLAQPASLHVQLPFGSLPSAQGWTYTPSGAHASVLEPNVFSGGGSVFTQNSIGQSNGVTGGSMFYVISGGMTTGEAKKLLVRARCLQVDVSAGAPTGQGGV